MTSVEALLPRKESRAKAERLYEHHEDHIERPVIAAPLQATPEMCIYCFDVIMCHFEGSDEPAAPFPKEVSCPFFVSWEKDERGSSGRGSLRGCIGTLTAQPLSKLRDYAHNSAFYDRRFNPITLKEMLKLKCSVSLLVQYEQAENAHDWEVGKHGILISFTDKAGVAYSATYLPEVAKEQGWSREQALESLVRKSGYSGSVSSALLARIKLTRYQSSKYGLHFTAYQLMKATAAATAAATAGAAAAASGTKRLR